MPGPDLKKALESTSELRITVTGRKSGKKITLPVWFVSEQGKLLLLPVQGSQTNWYQNVKKTPTIVISAAGASATLKASPSARRDMVSDVAEKFRAKYGAADVKKYYSNFDACVEVALP